MKNGEERREAGQGKGDIGEGEIAEGKIAGGKEEPLPRGDLGARGSGGGVRAKGGRNLRKDKRGCC